MARILVLAAANLAINPRPRRMIESLKNRYEVCAMGINTTSIEGVETLSYPHFKKRSTFKEFVLYTNVALRNWQKLIYTPNRLEIVRILQKRTFDLIICHDLVLLPIVLAYKGKARVLFDAREFYPTQDFTNLRWRILFARFNDFLCREYLPQVDVILTVSKGLQERYKYDYNVDCELFLSLPSYYDLSPHTLDPKNIKIIYHGATNPNRKIENAIKISDNLQKRFCFDLMLVDTNFAYMKKLRKMIQIRRDKGQKISIIPPVSFEEIIPFTSTYDIGFYSLPPSNFNLKHALPNKFFEYIQARLALVITPNIEMENIMMERNVGVVTSGFSPSLMAKTINALMPKQIIAYKNHSNYCAKLLNMQSNQKRLEEIIAKLC